MPLGVVLAGIGFAHWKPPGSGWFDRWTVLLGLRQPPDNTWPWILVVTGLLIHFLGLIQLAQWAKRPPQASQNLDSTRAARHVFVIGLHLAGTAGCCVIALCGSLSNHQFPLPAALTQVSSRSLASFLATGAGFAALGTLVYVALRIHQQWAGGQHDPAANANNPQPFDPVRLWGELFLRMGEAVVFTLLVFLYLVASASPTGSSPAPISNDELRTHGFYSLPWIGLLIGISIKSAEQAVLSLASRLIAVVQGLLGGKNNPTPVPPAPPGPPAPPSERQQPGAMMP
jgi:hypothetical protein